VAGLPAHSSHPTNCEDTFLEIKNSTRWLK
jgi:hypothetical protein